MLSDELLEMVALMLEVLINIVARCGGRHQTAFALFRETECGIDRFLKVLSENDILRASDVDQRLADFDARVGSADEVADTAFLKITLEARIIDASVSGAFLLVTTLLFPIYVSVPLIADLS